MKAIIMPIIYNLSVFGMCAFAVTHLKIFRKTLHQSIYSNRDRLLLILLFGALAALGNFLSVVDIKGALANNRTTGIVLGGLLGGPLVGIGAGILGAIPRYFLGGFTMPAAVASSLVIGLVSGLISSHYGKRGITLKIAFITALISELILKLMVLIFSVPFDAALELEKKIALPTIIGTCVATVFFISIVRHIFAEEEKVQTRSAVQAMQVIRSADQVLTNGLNEESAALVANIIYKELEPAAVAVTSPTKVLSYIGVGSDHHLTGSPIITNTSKRVCLIRQSVVARTKIEVGCPNESCPLTGVIEAPLIVGEKLLGSIKLFKVENKLILPYEIELIEGIARFLSSQLANHQAERQEKLLREAEYRILKAQVNPHFLFNTLATIHVLIRNDGEAARRLTRDLSNLLRRTLSSDREMVPLWEEMETVRKYVNIEQARFGPRLAMEVEIPDRLYSQTVPVFTIQPLVENAIKHGLSPRSEGGRVKITAWQKAQLFYICVKDNGLGITDDRNTINNDDELPAHEGPGIGLSNIKSRLAHIYGDQGNITINSKQGIGTEVTLTMPLCLENEPEGTVSTVK
ncbi:Sensor histidine kinase BtsS [bioreactor metagenome]|uniref:Sensor histidine kinase BtsS n=1 Tax=bioreactor metagenome TaxID=1076179 RepID=A0A644TUM6_9ZZZZ|nr:LytS/YhcK type 5TM receptor domain-containing protein [Negativicutes bacterium]